MSISSEELAERMRILHPISREYDTIKSILISSLSTQQWTVYTYAESLYRAYGSFTSLDIKNRVDNMTIKKAGNVLKQLEEFGLIARIERSNKKGKYILWYVK